MAGSDLIEINGKILELLPNAMFKVELENKKVILCHVSGKMRMKYIKIIAGDQVKVQVSPYDLNRGRIVFREKKSVPLFNNANFIRNNKKNKRK